MTRSLTEKTGWTISSVRTDSESAELLKLFDFVFGPEEGSRLWLTFHGREPFCTPECCKVVKREGHIVAHVAWVPRELRVGSAVVRAGAVGWVATHPEHRRQGLASALLEDWTCKLTERGEHISFLTGIPKFYERFGYEYSFHYGCTVSIDRTNLLTRDSSKVCLRHYRDQDLPNLVELYNRENATRIGSLVRTPEYWKWLLEGLNASGRLMYDDIWLAENADSDVVGYAMVRAAPEDRLEVWEAAAADGEAPALLNAIAARAYSEGRSRVDLLLPLDHLVTQLALTCGPDLTAYEHGVHARILDLQGLFWAMRAELSRRLGESGARGWRGTVRLVTDIGAVNLAISDGRVDIAADVEPAQVLEVPQSLLLKLVTGYADLRSVARSLDALRSDRIETALWPILEALFPRGCPYMWNADVGF